MSEYFGLSRANYLTIPRSIIEDMPIHWQRNLAAILMEVDERYNWPLHGESVEVRLRDKTGRLQSDPLAEYRHPDLAALEKSKMMHSDMKEQRKDV